MAAEQQADSADYAVALNELAQLKLSEVGVQRHWQIEFSPGHMPTCPWPSALASQSTS